ncbi:MAG: class I SAM-dependent methyltransferase [Acidimicrobiales bacterium]|nr:class I SAM-dependent methyltransferase [Acidimicrobiales bacterium]
MTHADDDAGRSRSLAALRAEFGDGPLFPRLEGDVIEVDGVTFRCGYEERSTADDFVIVKVPAHVAALREMARAHRGAAIVELGIAEGGSTALLALEAAPRRLVAVDLEAERLEALDRFIADRGLGGSVSAHYGVDQADRAQLGSLVDGQLDGAPIDLVIDDASHQLDPTRTSFEVLFPRLRPGGLYAIEDWSADHTFRDAVVASFREASDEQKAELAAALTKAASDPAPAAPKRPLTDLAVELVLARATFESQIVAEVIVSEFWLMARRGPAELPRDGWTLGSAFDDHFGYLR